MINKITNYQNQPNTVWHLKPVSKESKPIKQSKIITQQTETLGKPNIKSIIIDHSETATKLSKPIKQTKVITQKQKHKIKFYAETKAADRMLKLGLLKRHIFPKNSSKCYEFKILNSKKSDESFNFGRCCVKKKILNNWII